MLRSSVGEGGDSEVAAEEAGEIELAGEAAGFGDVGDAALGACEVLAGHLKAAMVEPGDGGEAGFAFEDAAEVNRMEADGVCPIFEEDDFAKTGGGPGLSRKDSIDDGTIRDSVGGDRRAKYVENVAEPLKECAGDQEIAKRRVFGHRGEDLFEFGAVTGWIRPGGASGKFPLKEGVGDAAMLERKGDA